MIFENNFSEVTTFESFYKNVININGNIIFPYVNVGVSSHKLNPGEELLNIDRSYIVCYDAIIHKINEDIVNTISYEDKVGRTIIYLGGVDLDKDIHTEMEIYCRNVFLQTLDDSKLQSDFWIPIKKGVSEFNMDENVLRNFFSNNHLPENLRKLITESLA